MTAKKPAPKRSPAKKKTPASPRPKATPKPKTKTTPKAKPKAKAPAAAKKRPAASKAKAGTSRQAKPKTPAKEETGLVAPEQIQKPQEGRPPHAPTEVTRAEVIAMRTYGVPIKEIAAYIGITDKTLYRYYRAELEAARGHANSAVGKFLYRAATGMALKDGNGATFSDCTRAAIFWAKTRMGFSETSNLKIDDPNGTLRPTTITIKPASQQQADEKTND